MKIAILGSTGFLGQVLLKKALEDGYQIKTLVRNPDKLGALKEKVEYIEGNLFNAEDVEKTVSGTKAVLSAAGPPQRNPGDPQIYRKAMENLVTILEDQNVDRFIHTGGAVHDGGENETWTIGRRMLRLFLNLFGKPILVAKALEWDVLKKSKISWTLVRPPRIVEGRTKGKELVADEKNLASLKVGVEELAVFMLDQIHSETWIKKAPLVACA